MNVVYKVYDEENPNAATYGKNLFRLIKKDDEYRASFIISQKEFWKTSALYDEETISEYENVDILSSEEKRNFIKILFKRYY